MLNIRVIQVPSFKYLCFYSNTVEKPYSHFAKYKIMKNVCLSYICLYVNRKKIYKYIF